MNGFSSDIVSILRSHALTTPRESIGLVYDKELYDELVSRGLVVARRHDKLCRYDYIVIDRGHLSVSRLLTALTNLRICGIIVIDVTGKEEKYQGKYVNIAKGMRGTKVIYGDRTYIVLHVGKDYGN